MTNRNFTAYFLEQLSKVAVDLTPFQYETLSDVSNLSAKEIAVMIEQLRTDVYQQELDWLYTLTQPTITRAIHLVNPLCN